MPHVIPLAGPYKGLLNLGVQLHPLKVTQGQPVVHGTEELVGAQQIGDEL